VLLPNAKQLSLFIQLLWFSYDSNDFKSVKPAPASNELENCHGGKKIETICHSLVKFKPRIRSGAPGNIKFRTLIPRNNLARGHKPKAQMGGGASLVNRSRIANCRTKQALKRPSVSGDRSGGFRWRPLGPKSGLPPPPSMSYDDVRCWGTESLQIYSHCI
jgi:hypothetical protein